MYITKPTNPELLGKLEKKVEDYGTRTRKILESQATALQGSIETNPDYLDLIYKRTILRAVLDRGGINVDTFRLEYETQHGQVNDALFRNAVAVIQNYSTGNVNALQGGTGLDLKKHFVPQ
jgi:hypothetical protein